MTITSNQKDILKSNIYIVTVPTPVDKNNKPNLSHLILASNLMVNLLNQVMQLFSSQLFSDCTEEICVPIIEKKSKLVYNKDFSDTVLKINLR